MNKDRHDECMIEIINEICTYTRN